MPETTSSADEAGAITCRFCGLVHDPVASVRVTTPRRGSSSHVGLIASLTMVGALIVAVLGVAAAVLVWSGRLASTVSKGVASAIATPALTSAGLAVRDLATIAPGRHALDAVPPAGGYGALDAVAQVSWALTIAQGWAADARLERIDVNRLRPDGTVNVADDAEASVRYRFISPQAVEALVARRQTSARATATTAFWVEVANGRANAVAIEDGARRLAGQALTPHPDALPLTGLVPVLARTPKYRAPFLNGYMIHLDDEGWVWYFSPLGGEALPRVRAVDGAAWPYRRAK